MNAKECLNSIREYDVMIDSKLAEVDALYTMITRITPVLKTDMVASGGADQDKIGNALAKIIDLKDEINRDIDHFVDKKREVIALLMQIGNPLYYQVLHKRYFLYQTFEQIALEMDYSYRGICYLHGRALQAFERLMANT